MGEITAILTSWSSAPKPSRARVLSAMYDELKRQAAVHLRGDRIANVLHPTELVHEAYEKLVDVSCIDMNGRTHFLGIAGRIMRQVLVDEARRARAQKRDDALQTHLTGDVMDLDLPVEEMLTIDRLLSELETIDPMYSGLIEARVFAGMTFEEAADEFSVSVATVKRKWRIAIAWLREKLGERSENGTGHD